MAVETQPVLGELCADIAQLRVGIAAASKEATRCRFRSAGSFRTHRDAVSGVCVAPGGIAVTCSWDSWLSAFDLTSWREGAKVRVGPRPGAADGGGAGSTLLAVAARPCRPGEPLVGCAGTDASAWLWRPSENELEPLVGHGGDVNDIDFHPHQESVACTASDDRKAIIWDLPRREPVRALVQHAQPVCAARFLGGNSAYDQVVATASADELVRLWDVRAKTLQCALPLPADRRLCLAAHAQSHLLVAGTDHGAVAAWDLRTLRPLQYFDLSKRGDFDKVTSLAVSPCCSYLAVGFSSGQVLVYDLLGQGLQALGAHEDAVFGLVWGSSWPWRQDQPPYLLCASHDVTWSCWAPEAAPAPEAWDAVKGAAGWAPWAGGSAPPA